MPEGGVLGFAGPNPPKVQHTCPPRKGEWEGASSVQMRPRGLCVTTPVTPGFSVHPSWLLWPTSWERSSALPASPPAPKGPAPTARLPQQVSPPGHGAPEAQPAQHEAPALQPVPWASRWGRAPWGGSCPDPGLPAQWLPVPGAGLCAPQGADTLGAKPGVATKGTLVQAAWRLRSKAVEGYERAPGGARSEHGQGGCRSGSRALPGQGV